MQAAHIPLRAGDVFVGKYRIDRELGRGGMGYVLAATHLHTHEPVALKFLLPEVAELPGSVERFLREARAASRIRSEHVARVLDVDIDPSGNPYMVMEFLDGHDLGRLIERQELPLDVVVDYVLQACEALAEAHVQGIVHRDLKPSNLFLTHRRDGAPQVKVLDFGISRISTGESAQLTKTNMVVGSPAYMSPEQLTTPRDIDARSDVWSLGVTLFELITRTQPFEHETHYGLVSRVLAEAAPSLRDRRRDCPEDLDMVVQRCLAKHRDQRFASVAALAAALEPFAPMRSRLSIERISLVMMPAPVAPCRAPQTAPTLIEPPPSSGQTSAAAPDRLSLEPHVARPPLSSSTEPLSMSGGSGQTNMMGSGTTQPPWVISGSAPILRPPPLSRATRGSRTALFGVLALAALGLAVLVGHRLSVRDETATAAPVVFPPVPASSVSVVELTPLTSATAATATVAVSVAAPVSSLPVPTASAESPATGPVRPAAPVHTAAPRPAVEDVSPVPARTAERKVLPPPPPNPTFNNHIFGDDP